MMKQSKLLVSVENKKIGELIFDPGEDKFYFNYDEQWKKNGFPLSPHLPLNGEINSAHMRRYLENQFPEGKGLEILLEEYRIGKSNTFRIIQLIGNETTGALRFSDPNQELKQESGFREVSEDELLGRLNKRNELGLVMWDGKPRLSVAGVQDKLPMTVLPNGKMGFGEGTLASTHILKFQKESTKIQFLVLNEYFCMKLANAIKLATAEVQYKKIGPHPILFVSRFDRELINDQLVKRIHVIDGCQALNLPSSYKYERNFGNAKDVRDIRDGATLKQIFEFIIQCQTPAAAILQTMNWMIFNLCISNVDSHAKNTSYFIDQDGINPAPFYDLVNISIYPDLDQELAMSIGDEFNPVDVKAFQLRSFCEDCNIQPRIFVTQLKKLGKRIIQELDRIEITSLRLNAKELKFIDDLKQNIRDRTEQLLDCVDEILKMPATFR
ncbi:MAG: HipA domain-containing protein [Bacteriovoracaceae bacterium]